METDISLRINQISLEEYLEIRKAVNWKKLSHLQAAKALENSLYKVGAYEITGDKARLIGMGRLVGDGSVICYVQDLIVIPEYQKKGIGSLILNTLTDFVKSIGEPDTEMMLCLMCAKGRQHFYEEHGFIARPTDELGPGMIQYLRL